MARTFSNTASFSRPADTTAYADGDGVSNDVTTPTAIEFKEMSPIQAMGGKISSAVLHKTDQDLTLATFDLYLFTAAPLAAGFNDNAAIAITDAEWQTCIGFFRFLAADGVSVVTGDLWNRTGLDLCYSCEDSATSLYGVVVARDGYTPGSGETFTLTLCGEFD